MLRKIKTTEELIKMFQNADKLPFKPEQKPLKDGTILDENQTVKWNREQVALSQQKYQKERKELQKQRAQAYNDAYEETCFYIQKNLNELFPLDKCAIIYNKAYESGHAYGYQSVMDYVDEYIDLINEFIT